MTLARRVLIDLLFVLSVALIGGGSYLQWGLAPTLILLGWLLLVVALAAQILGDRHVKPTVRE